MIQSVLVTDGNRVGETLKDLNILSNPASSNLERLEYLKPRRGRMLWKNKLKGKGRKKKN